MFVSSEEAIAAAWSNLVGESQMEAMLLPKVHLETSVDLFDCHIQTIGGGWVSLASNR